MVAFSQASRVTRRARSSGSHSRDGDEVGERLRQLDHQRLPGRRRQVVARQDGVADRGQMPEPLHDAVERERHDLGLLVLQQREAGFGAADLGDRSRNRARQAGAAGDRNLPRRLAARHRLDQVGIEQQRRTLQHRSGDVRLILRQRMHHRRRRAIAAGEHLGERAAHQRRRIVEQHDHGAFGGGAIVVAQIGIQKCAGQRAGGFGAITGGSGAQPVQELTDDHAKPRETEGRGGKPPDRRDAPAGCRLAADL